MHITVGTTDLRQALQAVTPHAFPRADSQDLHRIRCDIGDQNLTLTATNRYTAGLAIVSIWDNHDGELGPFDISPTDAAELLAIFRGAAGDEEELGDTLELELTGKELVVTDTGGLFAGKRLHLPRLPHGNGFPNVAGVITRALHHPATKKTDTGRWIADGKMLGLFTKASRAYGHALSLAATERGNQLISCGDSFLGLLVPSRDEEVAQKVNGWHVDWIHRLPQDDDVVTVLSLGDLFPGSVAVAEHAAAHVEHGRAAEEHQLLRQAAELVIGSQLGSASMVQRKLRIRHTRALNLLDRLEQARIVGPAVIGKAREVLIPADSPAELLDKLLPPPAEQS